MRALQFVAIGLTLVLFLFNMPAQAADETTAKGKIVGVDLFKNGLVVVKCEMTLGKSGTYVLEDVPSPVHGTYWVDSPGATVDTQVKMRDVEVPVAEAGAGNLQADLAGKKATVHFKGANRPPVVGTIMKLKPAKGEEAVALNRFLLLQTGKGRVYIDSSDIASVEAEDAGDKVIRRKPRLLLTLGETEKPETKVTLRYLTHGMAWAPSYRIDITDPKTLTVEQHAVLRNELAEIDGAEVRLISGFPSVEFMHVRSPLAPGVNWGTYFSELGSRIHRDHDVMSNVVTQQSIGNRRSPVNTSIGAIPAGEGVDLHYQSIGKRSLAEGESLALTVAKGKADYERIVEWTVPDSRSEYGHAGNRGDDEAWDALKFKNPLAFPMTTAPAMVTAAGQFNGQRTSYFTNSGEEMVLRVEKALSVRTRATENESIKENSGRDVVWIGGRQFRKSTVEGEVTVGNHRKEGISMVIRRGFSGEMVSAEGAPKVSLREDGVYSINKRNEMLWTLTLKGGEEKKFKYVYTVLVAV
ncbi:MAG: hypothetical protein K8U57_01695 [Planctomycetes bacterium]|nr:hypothetical protein [Planctomycetota bacterium]